QTRAHGCGKEQADRLLRETGRLLLESARTSLQADPLRRSQERLAWPHPLVVRPITGGGELGAPVSCQGKDLSLSGIGFYADHALPTAQVCIELPRTEHTPALMVPASIVRVQRCGDGWFEVGALFLPPA